MGRTLVFVSDIPSSLLEPASSDPRRPTPSHSASTRDPRYERLRQCVLQYSSGVMYVVHLQYKPYGFILYASEEEALAACKADMYVDYKEHHGDSSDPASNEGRPKLKLRIVEKEKPMPPPSVYVPTVPVIMEEGNKLSSTAGAAPHRDAVVKEIPKEDLLPTRGLELYYRGRALPLLCEENRQQRDCVFGNACHQLHLKGVQKTIRKRPKLFFDSLLLHSNGEEAEEEERAQQYMLLSHLLKATTASQGEEGAIEAVNVEALYRRYPMLTPEEKQQFQALEDNVQTAFETLFPKQKDSAAEGLLLTPRISIPLSKEELQYLTHSRGREDHNHPNSSVGETLAKRIDTVLKENFNGIPHVFARLSIPHGAPWDWSLNPNPPQDSTLVDEDNHNIGFQALQAQCPYPSHGCPTPLDRDIYLQQLFYFINQQNKWSSGKEVLSALRASERVQDSLGERLEGGALSSVSLILTPFLSLPTVGSEVTVFYEGGGDAVLLACQRYSALRYMTSSILLDRLPSSSGAGGEEGKDHDRAVWKQLERYAVLGRGEDVEAEWCLETEIQQHQPYWREAVSALQRCLRARHDHGTDRKDAGHSEEGVSSLLPPRLPWCAQLAIVPYATSSSSLNTSDDNNNKEEDGKEKKKRMMVKLLSFSPYRSTLEACPMFHQLLHAGDAPSSSSHDANGGEKSVVWNTEKHQYIPLISREVMDRLK